MRLPNGYGTVVNLGGRRRKPYAVRITIGRKKDSRGNYIQKYKYLEYFEKSKDAYNYLAAYNSGKEVKEHVSLCQTPTFKEVYDEWLSYKKGLKKPPTKDTIRNYNIAFNRYADLHHRKFITLKTADYQPIADRITEKSESTVVMTKTVLKQMYEYALRMEYVEKNYTDLIMWDYTNSEVDMHIPFTEKEIDLLWNNKDVKDVDKVLMLIYSGLRAKEFLGIEIKNINLKEKYLIGGMKTEAGKDRIIPIHDSVFGFYMRYYDKNCKYLFQNTRGNQMEYTNFITGYWGPLMKRLKLDHTMHDTRHTFATLADKYKLEPHYIKLIMGHALEDITKGIYTHVEPQTLVAEINKIKV